MFHFKPSTLLRPFSTSSCLTNLSPTDIQNAYTRLAPLAHSAHTKHTHLSTRRNTGQPLASHQAIHLRTLQPIANLLDAFRDLSHQLDQLDLISTDPSSDDLLLQLATEERLTLQSRLHSTTSDLILELISSVRSDDLRDPHAAAILEIRAGTGGDEAALFVADLTAMYEKLAARHAWNIKLLSKSETNIGGIREIILRVSGPDVVHTLEQEAGVHRVQRVPATEGQGRVHTSTASVAVLTDVPEMRHNVRIAEGDVKIDVYRASGAGGQHVNKTESAVRVTHVPTGLVATSQEDRSQHRNRAIAMEALTARVAARQAAEKAERRAAERRAQLGSMAGERSDRIRTYNFPQKRVTDHRIVPHPELLSLIPSAKNAVGEKSAPLMGVMDGGPQLDGLIASVKRAVELDTLQLLIQLAAKEKKLTS